MIVFLVLLAVVSFYKVSFSHYHEDYISKDSTNAIKGIFAIIILMSHMKGYLHLTPSMLDTSYKCVLDYIGQMMVAPYFFYSGYGIMESIKKNPYYFKSFPHRRIFKTLLHFDFAVLLFIIVETILGKVYPWHYYLTCWIGWESVGNSNWFIFDILSLYLIAYVAMLINTLAYKRENYQSFLVGSLIISCFTTLLFAFLFFAKHGYSWWINTLITFPLGFLWSQNKKYLEGWLSSNLVYFVLTFVLLSALILWHMRFGVDTLGVSSSLFILLLVIISMRIKFNNIILNWLGVNSFAIYILQRLPMDVLTFWGLNDNKYVFSVLSLMLVLLIASLFTKSLSRLDKLLFAKERL